MKVLLGGKTDFAFNLWQIFNEAPSESAVAMAIRKASILLILISKYPLYVQIPNFNHWEIFNEAPSESAVAMAIRKTSILLILISKYPLYVFWISYIILKKKQIVSELCSKNHRDGSKRPTPPPPPSQC